MITSSTKNPDAASHEAPSSIAEGFLRTTERYPDITAVRTVDGAISLTWRQVRERVSAMAAGLQRLGVRHGDTVALMLKNRPEFLIADVAVMSLGAIPYSIYATLPAVQIVPILDNADTKFAICENAFVSQLLGAAEKHLDLRTVIVLEGGGPAGTIDWADVETGSAGFDLDTSIAQIRPDDLGVLVYTSGTTGPAKGVEITHGSLVKLVETNSIVLRPFPGQRLLSWLPTAHMGERATSHYLPLLTGGTIGYCQNPTQVMGALREIQPHVFFAAPRFWEKLKSGIEAQWAALPDAQRKLVHDALQTGLEKVRLEQEGKAVSSDLAERYAKADHDVFRPIRKALGLDTEDSYLASGGASAPRALLEFFFAIGLPPDEVYGLTESNALGTRAVQNERRIGTVGKVQPGVEMKLAEDGEILIRSPAIMRGYRKQPDATAKVKDKDGWLHSGDIGTVDAEGYYRIVDRKKDVIINSFGKNMSPSNIEMALTTAGPFIAQAIVVGEARNYNVALLTLDTAYVSDWAAKQGLSEPDDLLALANNPRVVAQVNAEIDRGNAQLARVEQIKKFKIVGGEWTVGGIELTPTMKLKRRVILDQYAETIDELYARED